MPTFPDGTSLLHIQKRYIAKYYSQHTIAETLGPPYVYHVELNDTRALLGAIAAIHENPPRQSFVPEQYKEENFVERVRKIVRHPWCGWVSDGAARRGAGRAEALFPFA